MPSDFDFAAAGRLSTQLNQLASKLHNLVDLRDRQRRSLLGNLGSINWQGAKREKYDEDFGRQQSALKRLAEAALSAKQKVDDAITHAHQAQKAHH
jgi:hypothetical protein